MKRKLLSLFGALLFSASAFAQLPYASPAPNFVFKDLNGNTQDLYAILATGKTVFLDVSAAWCNPCWVYHKSGALETLWKQHGPTGGNGVNASTTNDVMVLMLEMESTNTRAQLYGPAVAGSYATQTQGDWVTGTLYPIIDTNAAASNAFKTAWNIGYFPTMYMVCRDRLVYEVGQMTAANLYAAAQAGCPNYAPSSTVDAKAITYTGTGAFYCTANPTVKFQNYSTGTLTSATVKVYSGATVVATYPWTGSLAPYAVASATVPAFTGSDFTKYKFEVVATGDTKVSNNISEDSLFKVYMASNAKSIPASEGFEGGITTLPYYYTATGSTGLFYSGGALYKVTSAAGTPTTAIGVGFANQSAGSAAEFIYGSYNTASATNVTLEFDYTYTPVDATSNDKMEVLVSKDCGATWASAWSKTGSALQTVAPTSKVVVTTTASSWRHETVSLTTYKNANMIVKLKGTTGSATTGGGWSWVDNIKITPTLDVNNVISANSVSVFPNPSREAATLEMTLAKTAQVVISITDATGRTVANVADATMQAGAQKITIPTAALAAGLYNITIRTEAGMLTQRLSVVK